MAALQDSPKLETTQSESPARVVWALAWPAVALNSLQVINTLVDRFFIGHLPVAALTGHSASLNVAFFMITLAMSLATGATAIVSRAFGANEPGEVRMASHQALGLAMVTGLVSTFATIVLCGWVATALLPPSDFEAKRQMVGFLSIFALGLPAINIIQALAGCLRGVGDTKSPMVISGGQIALHLIMNFLFVFPYHDVGPIHIPGLGLGLRGAALALTISSWIAAIVYLLYSGRTPLGEQWRIQPPSWAWAKRILRIATPAALMGTLRVIAFAAFTLVLKIVPDGSVAIAAMGVSFSIESIMFMPSFGLSMATGALVGQSLGMEKPDRAERLAWTAAHHAGLVTVLLSVPIFLFAPQICGLMLGDKTEVILQASSLLRFLCVSEVGFAYAMVMLGAMQGAGDTVKPFWITVIALWILRLPMCMVFSLASGQELTQIGAGLLSMPFGLAMGPAGTWLGISISQGAQGVMAVLAFRQGSWKTAKV